MTELKPCPFCGGKADTDFDAFIRYDVEVQKFFWIVCSNCGCRTRKHDGSNKGAIYQWNRRVGDK